MVIRSWNLFHGNSCPPRRRSYLEEMVRLASADAPGALLLQEVPVWALGLLDGWSVMTAFGDVARRPQLGPLPIPAGLARTVTSFHPGLLRSVLAGQGNAILLDPDVRPVDHDVLTLNPPAFRRATGRALGLDAVARLAWARERRICQAVRAEPPGSAPLVVANLHASSFPSDPRIPAAELDRAARWVDSLVREGDIVVLGGDLNIVGESLARLPGYSEPGPWIDHILVRGARPSPLRVWPDEERRREGMLLSDHAPIELEI